LRLGTGREHVDAKQVVSNVVGSFDNLQAPITINLRRRVIFPGRRRIPLAQIENSRILEDFKSLEIELSEIADFFGRLSDPGLYWAFEQPAHDLQIPAALSE